MTTKKGGAARPSLDIANARSRCLREPHSAGPVPFDQDRKVLRVAAHRSPRRQTPGRRRAPGRSWALDARSSPYSTVTDLARFLGWSTSQPRRIATSRARSCSGTVAVMALKASRTLGTQMI